MLRSGLFYERRKNYYANQGHPPNDLINPLYLAAGYVALVLKQPHKAVTLRSKFMRSPEAYSLVFNENAPIEVWVKISKLLKKVDSFLESIRKQGKATDRFLKSWRYITALLVLVKYFQRFSFSATDLSKLDIVEITNSDMNDIWNVIKDKSEKAKTHGWGSKERVLKVCKEFSDLYGISDVKSMQGNSNHVVLNYEKKTAENVSPEFVQKIKSLLPAQPWKPKMHIDICKKIGCKNNEYFSAVEILIEDGHFLRQRDGVLYDSDGSVVSFDPDRVNPETLELIITSDNK